MFINISLICKLILSNNNYESRQQNHAHVLWLVKLSDISMNFKFCRHSVFKINIENNKKH